MVYATVAVLLAGSIAVAPQAACPAQSTVAAEVARLGARRTLEQVGAAEVTVEGDSLRILIRDGSGAALGSRTVVAPVDCQARAELAAVLIAAWTGEWIKTSLGSEPGRPAAVPATSESIVERLRLDIAALGFGMHDGDAGAWGGGALVEVRRQKLGVVVLGDGVAERRRALGPGQARYRLLRAGAGGSARQQWGWVFADVSLVPELVRYAIAGEGLVSEKSTVSWALWADLRVRFGLSLGAISPFVYAGGSWSFLHQTLALDGGGDPVVLSRANLAAGLGISMTLRQ
jgi:hypothetical protein